jgi:transglutaminase-like putative cysteine protease
MSQADLRTFAEAGTVMDGLTFDAYLRPAELIDSGHPAVKDYAATIAGAVTDPVETAVRLYYAVRDEIRYDPYGTPLRRDAYSASTCLNQKHGYCITKAGLMTAVARAVGIPARVGYADVRNHMSTKKLSERMGTDTFYFHGYTDLWLGDRWVKCTPAFNIELTEKFRLKPLEFNGREDSIYHPIDKDGRRHMEYIAYRGVYADVPFETIEACFSTNYPHMQTGERSDAEQRDFAAEGAAEAAESDRARVLAHSNGSGADGRLNGKPEHKQ